MLFKRCCEPKHEIINLLTSINNKVKDLEKTIAIIQNHISEQTQKKKMRIAISNSMAQIIRDRYISGIPQKDILEELQQKHPLMKYHAIVNFINRDNLCREYRYQKARMKTESKQTNMFKGNV